MTAPTHVGAGSRATPATTRNGRTPDASLIYRRHASWPSHQIILIRPPDGRNQGREGPNAESWNVGIICANLGAGRKQTLVYANRQEREPWSRRNPLPGRVKPTALLVGALFWTVVNGGAGPTWAEEIHHEDNDFTLKGGLSVSAYHASSFNTYFGAGVPSGDDAGQVDHSWFEAVAQPSLRFACDCGGGSRWYGELSAVATTRENHLGGWSPKKNRLSHELAYVGWASGTMFDGLGKDALQVSVGNQRFSIGDGFLVHDGGSDSALGTPYWLAPHRAFKETIVVRWDVAPVRVAAFRLVRRGGPDADTRFAGVDLNIVDDALGVLGVSAFRIFDDEGQDNRDGMEVVSVRGQGHPFAEAGVPEVFLSGEYVRQTNDDTAVHQNAQAWYLEAGYEFPDLAWSPYVGYRYSRYAGDDPDTTETNEGYDPLFYGFGRGWGSWFQGEIIGGYDINTNMRVHLAKLEVRPADHLTVSFLYFDFDLDQPQGAAETGSYARELDIYVDWSPTESLSASVFWGMAAADKGATRIYGHHDNATIVGVYASYSF